MMDAEKDGPGAAAGWSTRALALILAACVLLGSPAFARAGSDADTDPVADVEGEPDPRGRFALFADVAPHVVVQRSKGSVSTNFGLSSSKANILTNMTFRLGGGMKAPELAAVWGRPRPVVWAGALIPINESSTIGTRFIETATPGSERLEFSKFAIEYQTSALAGLGLEFTVPVFDAMISVTPALQSLHLVTRYVGTANLQVNSTGLSERHRVREKKEITQHYLGPALRIGAPTVVLPGRIAIDFFLDAGILFDVAGTRRELTATGQNGDRGSFSFESGSGVAQVGSGIQVRWP